MRASVLVLAACGGTIPATHYYQLATPAPLATPPSGPVLAVAPLAADGAYDDERIVYRTDPVRLDYYEYRRWSATPGAMLGTYLQQALSRTGKFRAVGRQVTTDTALELGGRVVALEEVDETPMKRAAHVAVELTLTDPKSGEVVWTHLYDEREPCGATTPESLVRALGTATDRIVAAAAPEIARRAIH